MNPARLLLAVEYATKVHAGHARKYTGEPYMVHCISVARKVLEHTFSDDPVVAAILHDTVEDWPDRASFEEVRRLFGSNVERMVRQTTKKSQPEDGNRAKRKAIDNAWFSAADPDSQTIKLADLIDNTRTILFHDPDFAKVYMQEKRDLLTTMTRGDPTLYFEAKRMVDEYFKHQEIKAGS